MGMLTDSERGGLWKGQTDRLIYIQMNGQTGLYMCRCQKERPRIDRYTKRLTYRKINREISTGTYEIDGSKAIKLKSNLFLKRL